MSSISPSSPPFDDCGSWLSTHPVLNQRRKRQQNECVTRLERQIDAGGTERDAAIHGLLCPSIRFGSGAVHGRDGAVQCLPQMVVLAHESQRGSRLVQKAFKEPIGSPALWVALVGKLHGFSSPLATSKNGNHVIQSVFTEIPADSDLTQSVAKEIFCDHMRVITDQFGCRVVQRIVEHSRKTPSDINTANDSKRLIVDWIIEHAIFLSQHEFGHFPVESLLEHGDFEDRAMIVRKLSSEEGGPHRGKTCFVIQKVLDLGLLPQLQRAGLLPELDLQVLGWHEARELARQQAEKQMGKKYAFAQPAAVEVECGDVGIDLQAEA